VAVSAIALWLAAAQARVNSGQAGTDQRASGAAQPRLWGVEIGAHASTFLRRTYLGRMRLAGITALVVDPRRLTLKQLRATAKAAKGANLWLIELVPPAHAKATRSVKAVRATCRAARKPAETLCAARVGSIATAIARSRHGPPGRIAAVRLTGPAQLAKLRGAGSSGSRILALARLRAHRFATSAWQDAIGVAATTVSVDLAVTPTGTSKQRALSAYLRQLAKRPPPPPRRAGCFASPGACGYPDPAYGNVGVPSGTSLTRSGSIAVNTAGKVVSGLDVTGTITINASNVTIKNTRVTVVGTGCGPTNTCGNAAIRVACACTVNVSHVELTANAPTTVEEGIRNSYGGQLSADHVYQHGNVDMLCWCGDAVLRDNYSFIHLAIANDHMENLYFDDHTATIDHNTFLNPVPQTANIFANTNNGSGGACSNRLTVTNNLLAGGGFTIYPCGNASSVGSSMLSFTGNRIARCKTPEYQGFSGTWLCTGLAVGSSDGFGYYPRGGSYGHDAFVFCGAAGQIWAGNVWDDNNATVGC
jgi:hypothetical protein